MHGHINQNGYSIDSVGSYTHRREALKKWKSDLGKAATYRALIEVFFRAGRLDYAEFVCNLLKDNTSNYMYINLYVYIHVPCFLNFCGLRLR